LYYSPVKLNFLQAVENIPAPLAALPNGVLYTKKFHPSPGRKALDESFSMPENC
jgi:hypothetical protein